MAAASSRPAQSDQASDFLTAKEAKIAKILYPEYSFR
jgi:hypothetical protein